MLPDADQAQTETKNPAQSSGRDGRHPQLPTCDHSCRSRLSRGRIDIGVENGWNPCQQHVANRASTHSRDCPEQDGDERMHFENQRFFGAGDGEQRQPSGIETDNYPAGDSLDETMQLSSASHATN